MTLKKNSTFEGIFHDFVNDFGGEVLPEAQDGCTADYLFRKQNVIAELKGLADYCPAAFKIVITVEICPCKSLS